MRKTLTALGLVAVLALVGAACSSDDDGSEDVSASDAGGGTSSTTAADQGDSSSGEGRAVDVTAQDFEFDPSTIEAEPGEVLEITFTNEGNAPHTFTTEDDQADEEVQPGDSTTFTVSVPDSGTLAFECRFHAGSGMTGTIGTGDAAGAQSDDDGGGGSDDYQRGQSNEAPVVAGGY